MNGQFIVFSRSKWAADGYKLPDDATDEIAIGTALGLDDTVEVDGPKGQFVFRWYPVHNRPDVVRLEFFDDEWHYITAWPEFFKNLSNIASTAPTVNDIVDFLEEKGFTDVTPT